MDLSWAQVAQTKSHDLVHEMLEHDLKLEGVDPTKHLGKPPANVAR